MDKLSDLLDAKTHFLADFKRAFTANDLVMMEVYGRALENLQVKIDKLESEVK